MTLYRFDQIAENIRVPVMPKPEDSERYIGLEHMDTDSLRIRRWGADTTLIGQKLAMKKGDVLFAKRNAYIRRVAVAPFDGLFSAHGMVLRAKTDVCLHDFLPVFMQSDYFMERAIKISVGSLSPTINWSSLNREEFEIPSLDEQRRISDLLWAADDVIQKWETAKQSALQLLESTLFENFSSELIPGSKQNWEIVPLNQVAHLQTGIAKGKSYGKEIETVELPYLSVLNVQDGYIDLTGIKTIVIPKKEVGKYLLQSNDIVIAEGGDSDKVGRGAIWHGEIDICLHQNHIFCIRTNKEKLLSEFLSFQMRSRYGKAYFLKGAKKTSNLASINSTQVKQFPVLLCSLDIQNKIVSQITQLENAVNQIYEHLSVSVNLKKSLLAQFLS